jgi:hypothetical protein
MVKEDLPGIIKMEDTPARTAALAGWVQGLFSGAKAPAPVLVGGAALELYTRGACKTGDLDFVGELPAGVRKSFLDAGFRREGRHFIHETGRIFVEFPSRALGEGETSVPLRVGERRLIVISAEDLLVDRLAAWRFWGSAVDGANAFLLFRARGKRLDDRRLLQRARLAGVAAELKKLGRFAGRYPGIPPAKTVLAEWARRGAR